MSGHTLLNETGSFFWGGGGLTFKVVFDPADQKVAGQKLFQADRLLLGYRGDLLCSSKQVLGQGPQGLLPEGLFCLSQSQTTVKKCPFSTNT